MRQAPETLRPLAAEPTRITQPTMLVVGPPGTTVVGAGTTPTVGIITTAVDFTTAAEEEPEFACRFPLILSVTTDGLMDTMLEAKFAAGDFVGPAAVVLEALLLALLLAPLAADCAATVTLTLTTALARPSRRFKRLLGGFVTD